MNEDRRAYWRRRLGRLQFGAEPIEAQVARYRRATMALSGASAGVGALFVAIFSAFGRPGVGLAVVGVLLAPAVAWAWIDFARLGAGAAEYLRERAEVEDREWTEAPPG